MKHRASRDRFQRVIALILATTFAHAEVARAAPAELRARRAAERAEPVSGPAARPRASRIPSQRLNTPRELLQGFALVTEGDRRELVHRLFAEPQDGLLAWQALEQLLDQSLPRGVARFLSRPERELNAVALIGAALAVMLRRSDAPAIAATLAAALQHGVPNWLPEARLLVESYLHVYAIREPVRVSTTVPIYQANLQDLRLKLAELEGLYGLNPQFVTWEAIFVEDGSGEGLAAKVAQDLELSRYQREGKLRVLTISPAQKRQWNSRKGGAVEIGMRDAVNRGSQYVFFADQDRTVPMAIQGNLLAMLMTEADVAVGSRRIPAARGLVSRPWLRRVGSLAYRLVVWWTFPALRHVHDTQAGFKGFHHTALRRILPFQGVTVNGQGQVTADFDVGADLDLSFDTELLARAQAAGCRLKEVPLLWREYEVGSTTLAGGRGWVGRLRRFVELFWTMARNVRKQPARLREFAKRQATQPHPRVIAEKDVLVFDIDDTISARGKAVPRETVRLIERLIRDHGKQVVLVTARTLSEIEARFLKFIDDKSVLANLTVYTEDGTQKFVWRAPNGASVHTGSFQKMLSYRGELAPAELTQVVETIKETLGGDYPEAALNLDELPAIYVMAYGMREAPHYKMQDPDWTKRLALIRRLNAAFVAKKLDVQAFVGGTRAIAVRKADKGWAVRDLARTLRKPLSTVAVFADAFEEAQNDAAMALPEVYVTSVNKQPPSAQRFPTLIHHDPSFVGEQGTQHLLEQALRHLTPPEVIRSKALFATLPRTPQESPKKVSVVISTRSGGRLLHPWDHPDGQDALRKKIQQLDELFALNPGYAWELLIVDDGSRGKETGRAVEGFFQQFYLAQYEAGQLKVRYLEDALPEEGLTSTEESRKGGGVVYGMKEALRGGAKFVVYTDTDLSTDLRQLGLLLAPLQDPLVGVAFGSRWAPGARVHGRTRLARLSSWIYNQAVRTILPLGKVHDTQCGFKAFTLFIASRILSPEDDDDRPQDRRFSFDTELLLLAKQNGAALREVPIHWEDVQEGSAIRLFRDVPDMLGQLVAQRQRHLPGVKSHVMAGLGLPSAKVLGWFLGIAERMPWRVQAMLYPWIRLPSVHVSDAEVAPLWRATFKERQETFPDRVTTLWEWRDRYFDLRQPMGERAKALEVMFWVLARKTLDEDLWKNAKEIITEMLEAEEDRSLRIWGPAFKRAIQAFRREAEREAWIALIEAIIPVRGRLENPVMVRHLTALLKDPDPHLREVAAFILGEMRPSHRMVPDAIATALRRETDRNVRQTLRQADDKIAGPIEPVTIREHQATPPAIETGLPAPARIAAIIAEDLHRLREGYYANPREHAHVGGLRDELVYQKPLPMSRFFTNPLDWYEDSELHERVVVKGGQAYSVWAEYLGLKFLALMGVPVPRFSLVTVPVRDRAGRVIRDDAGQPIVQVAVAQEYLSSHHMGGFWLPPAFHQDWRIAGAMLPGLMLAERDRTPKNLLFADESLFHIDVGGSLAFRATGGFADFPEHLNIYQVLPLLTSVRINQREILNEAYAEALRDPEQLKALAARLAAVTDAQIRAMVRAAGVPRGKGSLPLLDEWIRQLEAENEAGRWNRKARNQRLAPLETFRQAKAAGGLAEYLERALIQRRDDLVAIFSKGPTEFPGLETRTGLSVPPKPFIAQPEVTVVMPTRARRNVIFEVLDEVLRLPVSAEMIIVVDGIDRANPTFLAQLRNIPRHYPNVRVVEHAVNRGKGLAIRNAAAIARGRVLVVQDTDGEYMPQDNLERVAAPILNGEADVVYGSRVLGAKETPIRYLNWLDRINFRLEMKLGEWFVRLLFVATVTDQGAGYKAFRTELLRSLDLEGERFDLEPELTAKMLRLGHTIREVPSYGYARRAWVQGKSFGFWDALQVPRLFWRYRQQPADQSISGWQELREMFKQPAVVARRATLQRILQEALAGEQWLALLSLLTLDEFYQQPGLRKALPPRERMALLSTALSTALSHPRAPEVVRWLQRRLAQPAALLPEAQKLIQSYLAVYGIDQPLRVTTVFAMHGEHARLQPASDTNPDGEDALRTKLQQLTELYAVNRLVTPDGKPMVTWELIAVNNGDDRVKDLFHDLEEERELSREVAMNILLDDGHPLFPGDPQLREWSTPVGMQGTVRLMELDDQIARQLGSKKGGAIVLGMHAAIAGNQPADVVIYTDADTSATLAQEGLILRELVSGGREVAAGSRRLRQAVVRNRPWKRRVASALYHLGVWMMLRPLGRFQDTQGALKGFRREVLEKILPVAESADGTLTFDPHFTYDFSFDTLLLLRAIHYQAAVSEIPILWVESKTSQVGVGDFIPSLRSVWRQRTLPRQSDFPVRVRRPVRRVPEMESAGRQGMEDKIHAGQNLVEAL